MSERIPQRWLGALLLALLAVAAGAELVVEDDEGRRVALPEPARRVVSMAPHLTELLFSAGAGERLVGVSEFSDWPPEARALPRIGGFAGVDLETVVALRPDLIVAWGSGNSRRQLDKLRALGFPLFISEPRRLEDVPRTLQRLGMLTGTVPSAGQAAAAFQTRLEALRKRFADRPRLDVFYQVWNRPLVTLSGDHLVSQVMDLCGGDNVFAALGGLAPQVNVEAVLAVDPQVIVASGAGSERPVWLDEWRRWPSLTAVAHDNLFAIPPDLLQRHSPRVLEGAELLCAYLDVARDRLTGQ